MNILEKLLAPYAAATSGAATPLDYLKQDSVYGTLFPDPVSDTPRQRQGGAGPAAASGIYGLAKQLEKMGFEVGELEGFQGEGQISSGHVSNSQHYSGDAMDVNYYGGGRWKNEPRALDWLNRYLQKNYNPSELLWRTDNHYDHLHAGFR